MKCRNCQFDLQPGQTVCLRCGANNGVFNQTLDDEPETQVLSSQPRTAPRPAQPNQAWQQNTPNYNRQPNGFNNNGNGSFNPNPVNNANRYQNNGFQNANGFQPNGMQPNSAALNPAAKILLDIAMAGCALCLISWLLPGATIFGESISMMNMALEGGGTGEFLLGSVLSIAGIVCCALAAFKPNPKWKLFVIPALLAGLDAFIIGVEGVSGASGNALVSAVLGYGFYCMLLFGLVTLGTSIGAMCIKK